VPGVVALLDQGDLVDDEIAWQREPFRRIERGDLRLATAAVARVQQRDVRQRGRATAARRPWWRFWGDRPSGTR